MRRFRPRLTARGLMLWFLTVMILLVGLSFVWRGPGSRLEAAMGRRAALQTALVKVQQRVNETNRTLLEGERGERMRSLFENETTIASCFDAVLGEIGARGASGGLLLRSVSLAPPEGESTVEKTSFEMEIEGAYPELTTWLRWLEEAYPVFHVNELALDEQEGTGGVIATLRGAFYLPGGGGGTR